MKAIRIILMLIGSVFLYLNSFAQYREPYMKLANLQELVNEIRAIPEDERFVYLSYTSYVNSEYHRIVDQVIMIETAITKYKELGTPENDRDYVSKLNDLKRFKKNLRKETERFLSYMDMNVRIYSKALEALKEKNYRGWLREDYFYVVYLSLKVEELLTMEDEALFLYFRDNGPVNYGYMELVDEMILKNANLEKLHLEETQHDKERLQEIEMELEQIMTGLRRESDRILNYYVTRAKNSKRAFEKALGDVEKEQQVQPAKI